MALAGNYAPLLPILRDVAVGTLILELCTPRAGELEVLAELPERLRIGVGVVNPKSTSVESAGEESRAPAKRTMLQLFGRHRVCSIPTAVLRRSPKIR